MRDKRREIAQLCCVLAFGLSVLSQIASMFLSVVSNYLFVGRRFVRGQTEVEVVLEFVG